MIKYWCMVRYSSHQQVPTLTVHQSAIDCFHQDDSFITGVLPHTSRSNHEVQQLYDKKTYDPNNDIRQNQTSSHLTT